MGQQPTAQVPQKDIANNIQLQPSSRLPAAAAVAEPAKNIIYKGRLTSASEVLSILAGMAMHLWWTLLPCWLRLGMWTLSCQPIWPAARGA